MGAKGIGCRVIRKPDGSVDKVLDIQGKTSTLYRDAFSLMKDEGRALSVWAVAYTSDFIHKYRWNISGVEPELHVVLDYIQRNKTGRFQMPTHSVEALTSLMSDSGYDTTRIKKILSENFASDGDVVVTKDRMIKSGIYSIEESENEDSYDMIRDTIKSILNSKVEDVFFIADSKPQYAIPDESGEVDALGRRRMVRGDVVYQELLTSLIGVKDESGIASALGSFKYPAFSELYYSDENIRREVRRLVSGIDGDIVSVQRIEGSVDSYDDWVSTINIAPNTSMDRVNKTLSDALDGLNGFKSLDVYMAVRRSEVELAKHGIDIVGLSDYMLSVPSARVSGILSKILSFTTNTNGILGDELFLVYKEMSELRRGDKKKKAIVSQTTHKNLFASDSTMSPREAFEKGFIRVGRSDSSGMYVRKSMVDKESIYSIFYNNTNAYKRIVDMYRWGVGLKEVFNKYSNRSDDESLSFDLFKEDLDRALLSESSYDIPEGLILESILMSIDPKQSMYNVQKKESDLSKLYSLVGTDLLMEYSSIDVDFALRTVKRKMLLDGANRSEMYSKFWSHVSIGENSLSIDREGISNINLVSDDDLNQLRVLAARLPNTSNETMRALSHGQESTSDISNTKEFKRSIYHNNPGLIENSYRGNTTKVYGGFTLAINEYSDYIRIDDAVYEKVSENDDGGVYYKLDGSNPSISYMNMEIEKNKKENFIRSFFKSNPISKMFRKDNKVNVRC